MILICPRLLKGMRPKGLSWLLRLIKAAMPSKAAPQLATSLTTSFTEPPVVTTSSAINTRSFFDKQNPRLSRIAPDCLSTKSARARKALANVEVNPLTIEKVCEKRDVKWLAEIVGKLF